MSLSRNLANVIFKKDPNIDDVIMLLEKYKLLSVLPSLLGTLRYLRDADIKETELRIESPFPIDDMAQSSIKRMLGNTDAKYTVVINKELLAGFKVRFNGTLYDASAQRMIQRFLMNEIK
jgi:F0F1-type ATP synthase delta subunit